MAHFLSSNETIKQAVTAGMGLSFLSLHMIGLEVRSGLVNVLDIEGTALMRMWDVAHDAPLLQCSPAPAPSRRAASTTRRAAKARR